MRGLLLMALLGVAAVGCDKDKDESKTATPATTTDNAGSAAGSMNGTAAANAGTPGNGVAVGTGAAGNGAAMNGAAMNGATTGATITDAGLGAAMMAATTVKETGRADGGMFGKENRGHDGNPPGSHAR